VVTEISTQDVEVLESECEYQVPWRHLQSCWNLRACLSCVLDCKRL